MSVFPSPTDNRNLRTARAIRGTSEDVDILTLRPELASPVLGGPGGSEVATVAARAGWRGDELVDAVAVAWEESSFNRRAISPTRCCYGYWQIHLKAHGKTAADMFDPQKNAIAANTIWREAGNTFAKDWSVWPVSATSKRIAERAIASSPDAKHARGQSPETGDLSRLPGYAAKKAVEGLNIDWQKVLLIGGGAIAIIFSVLLTATQLL